MMNDDSVQLRRSSRRSAGRVPLRRDRSGRARRFERHLPGCVPCRTELARAVGRPRRPGRHGRRRRSRQESAAGHRARPCGSSTRHSADPGMAQRLATRQYGCRPRPPCSLSLRRLASRTSTSPTRRMGCRSRTGWLHRRLRRARSRRQAGGRSAADRGRAWRPTSTALEEQLLQEIEAQPAASEPSRRR